MNIVEPIRDRKKNSANQKPLAGVDEGRYRRRNDSSGVKPEEVAQTLFVWFLFLFQEGDFF
ncbi:MAG: hypothetical protein IMY76_08875 [Chloroflexi bacterium]|nr:hypothetical protein [Chloroflexota bacterium]